MTDRRVCFDFEIEFSNGGGLQGQDFRLDIDGDDIDDEALAAFIIRDLRLLMVGRVRILNKQILSERHKRARVAEKADPGSSPDGRFIDLSRFGRTGGDGKAGTSIEIPPYRAADGPDPARLELAHVADVPGVLVRVEGAAERAIDWHHFVPVQCRGHAVLVQTGWDRRRRGEGDAEDHPFLTEKAAIYLRDQGAVLVGIDSSNIDDASGGRRPVRSVLLDAKIPVVEHLTGLSALPGSGFRFSAVPPGLQGGGSVPVRAYARISGA